MKAEACYAKNAEDFIYLHFIDQNQLSRVSKSTGLHFKAQQFEGKLGQVALVMENDVIRQAYLGQGNGSIIEAIAHGVLQLPLGTYWSHQSLSHRELVVWATAQYQFLAYKKKKPILRQLILNETFWDRVLIEVNAIFKARDLINTPANDMHPEVLLDELLELSKGFNAEYIQWTGEELLDAGFPAVYAVGQGSCFSPRLGMLTVGDPSHTKVALVGKGVCFDSGGLDIKPAQGMRWMKKDMGGAAITIALAYWILAMKLPICLQVIIPAVENAIGSRSYRPGDVLRMRNGLTVEIDNTDAEGRLIMADAMTKAIEFSPALLIDISTLTGAARIAVGTEISAFFTNDRMVAQDFFSAAEQAGDPVWQLPLYQGYAKMIDSSIADLSNSTSSGYAGAITAALFLNRFIDQSVKWIHIDTMAWNTSSRPGHPEGGEAMSLRALCYYLEKFICHF